MTARLLVTSDNFFIGGRERFLESYLHALQTEGIVADLLADNLEADFAATIFASAVDIPGIGEANLSQRLQVGQQLLERQQTTHIWAQHYSILPAFLLAIKNQLPLLITLHGSLRAAGYLPSLADRLGLVLALKHGAFISVVSQEISAELQALGVSAERIHVLPNRVPITLLAESTTTAVIEKPRVMRCVMLSRQQKLAHIRAGVQLFCVLLASGQAAELTIYTGQRLLQKNAVEPSALTSIKQTLSVLGRKWVLRNPRVLLALRAIRCVSLTDDPQKRMASADVVFGMGRVVLEALALAKPCVLVGYDRAIGLVSTDTIADYQYSNFSGRQQVANSLSQIAGDVRHAWMKPAVVKPMTVKPRGAKQTGTTQADVSVENGAADRVMQNMIDIVPAAQQLAKHLAKTAAVQLDVSQSEADFFQTITANWLASNADEPKLLAALQQQLALQSQQYLECLDVFNQQATGTLQDG